jgi:hypothetical protein
MLISHMRTLAVAVSTAALVATIAGQPLLAQAPGPIDPNKPKPPPQAQKPTTPPPKTAVPQIPPKQPPKQPVIKNVAPKSPPPSGGSGTPAQVPKKIVTPAPKSNVTPPPKTIVTPATPPPTKTPLTKLPPKIDPNAKTPQTGNLPPGATPIGKTIVPPSANTLPVGKIVTPPPGNIITKLPPGGLPPANPPSGGGVQPIPGKFVPLAKPPLQYVPKGPIQAAPGLNIPGLVFKQPPPKYKFYPPLPPPVPPPKWAGPATIPPAWGWHPWKGKNMLPYFVVGAVVGVGVGAVAYNYWTPPPPSCYLGGGVVYYYPGTKVCFDFATAVAGDPFVFEDRIYYWEPRRYRTVELLIAAEQPRAEPALGWADREPTRLTLVKSGMDRAASRAKSVAAVPFDQLDCSTCLAALGPTEGENGMCTVSLVNNCDHDVIASGGLALTSAAAGSPPLCDFQGEVPAGAEVAACTKPCGEFNEAQVFLNAVIPTEATQRPSPSCRVAEQREARAP